MWAMSWRSTDAPFAYEMPSKLPRAECASGAGDPATGWVLGARSAAYPHILRATPNSTHASVNSVTDVVTR
jgi:hypothetical protein